MRKLRKLVRSKSKAVKPVKIRNYRHDIKNKEVLNKIKEHSWSVNKCCEKFNCSKNLILSIVNKTRPDIDAEDAEYIKIKKEIPVKELCTSCGLRRKKKGNRFLCALCFDKGDSDEDSYYYMGFGYSSFLTLDNTLGDEHELQAEVEPMVDRREKRKESSETKGYNGSTEREGSPSDQ